MNRIIKSDLFRNFKYVFGSQIIVLISGLIKTLVIPVFLGLSDFGYWQIYVFYTVYIGIFTLGYGDGLYLKYGGYEFSNLPLSKIRTSNIPYVALLALGSIGLAFYAVFNPDPYRKIVFLAIGANVVILGITSIISLTLQATNLLKGYAVINSADKVFFSFALLALFNKDFRTLEYLIAIDLTAKLIVLVLLLQRYHQLYIGHLEPLRVGVSEFFSSISGGGALLLANLTGMLVLGVGRIVIEYFGDIDSYAYYAFAVSLSNIVLISITALSVVIYPSLKRHHLNDYLNYFNKTTKTYFVFILVMLCGYFPAVAFIELVAHQYAPVLQFLNIIFLVTVLQGKMQLVNNTFYKALRLERAMLVANATSLLIATLLSFAGFLLFHSILVVAYVAFATMLFRVYVSEFFLRGKMGEKFSFQPLAEVALLVCFVPVTLLLAPAQSALTWFLIVASVLLYKRQAILETWLQIRSGTK